MKTTATSPERSFIPYLFVAFFGFLFAADGLMAWLAVTTFTGLETSSPYEKGLAYNDTLATVRRQKELGWTTVVRLDRRGLVLAAADREGRPLRDATVAARLVRPADGRLDRTLVLTETRPGRYEAPFDLPAKGLWVVRSEVRTARDTFFATDRRVVR
ncbi:MAG: FixH family protein [Geminicoccaceae bacterium]|nr:FixH family protein [Geminicoccaceae bacterium]